MEQVTSLAHKVTRRVKRAARELLGPSRRPNDPASPLPVARLFDLITSRPDVRLQLIGYQDGNVRPVELLTIAAIVSEQKPLCVLEVGTFNGHTTLHMALNSPTDAKIYTLDLPYEPSQTPRAVQIEDLKYVRSSDRQRRAYVGTPAFAKIHQLFGDSATFNFREAMGGEPVNLAFIDGSHSYKYVQNDTEKVLSIMAPGGIILWHDYDFRWPGVCQYLNELGSSLALRRIEDTTIVYHRVSEK
jgi:predicted O-methyltransferase YrrM